MKVLLVNPPQQNLVTNNIPSIVDEERGTTRRWACYTSRPTRGGTPLTT